jgi:predicted secreted protein
MGAISGSLIGLKVNGAFVSCELSCEIQLDVEMLPATNPTSARWKEFIQGVRGWTMSVNAGLLLEAVPSDIKAIITTGYIRGLPMYIEFSTRASASIQMILSGACVFQNANITAPAQGGASYNVSFQGTGALSTHYHDYDLLIDAMPSEADYPITLEEDV